VIMALGLTKLPADLFKKCEEYAALVISKYAEGKNARSSSISTHGAQRNEKLWTEAKAAECIFALECDLDPITSLNWKPVTDHYDVMFMDRRIDVKSGQFRDTRLIWPRGKNHLYDQKQFDLLVFTKFDLETRSGFSQGWITKQRFRRERLIAGEDHVLDTGTRYIDQDRLDSMESLLNIPDDSDWLSLIAQSRGITKPTEEPEKVVENLKHTSDFKPGEPFEHPCYCGKPGLFGFGVSLRNEKLGTWYCGEHRPIPKG